MPPRSIVETARQDGLSSVGESVAKLAVAKNASRSSRVTNEKAAVGCCRP